MFLTQYLPPLPSPHAVGMIACAVDVRITFNIPLTILSAVVAVAFTFAAFSTGYTSDSLENSAPVVAAIHWVKSTVAAGWAFLPGRVARGDLESGHITATHSEAGDERRPMLASTSDHGDEDDDNDNEDERSNRRDPGHVSPKPHTSRNSDIAEQEFGRSSIEDHPAGPISKPSRVAFPAVFHQPFSGLRRGRSPPPPTQDNTDTTTSSARTSEDSTPLTATDSSEDSLLLPPLSQTSSSAMTSSTPTTLSSHSWSDPLHAGLSREARLRIKAQARDKPVPKFGWRYWIKQYYSTITFLVAVRAAVWGVAIVFMHYCGM